MKRKISYANEEEFKTLCPGCEFEVVGMNSKFKATSEPFVDSKTGELSILAGKTVVSYRNEIFVVKEADKGKVFNVDVCDVKTLAYALYQMDWKIRNRITPQDEIDAMKEYLKIYPPEKFTAANPPDETFDEWLQKHGYEGRFYHSYEYFMENFYENSFYVEALLSGTNQIEAYRKSLKEDKEEDELCM